MVIRAEVVADNGEELFLRVRKPQDWKPREIIVELDDGNQITNAQRRKVYVLLNCISQHTGYTPVEILKEMLKLYYLSWTGRILNIFSLSDCSRETATDFITFLIDFCLANGVACNEPLQSLCDDLSKYIYACLMNKKCACCGGKSDLHHVDAIGMGGNRNTMFQIGMKVLPLCRKHHTEIHMMPNEEFFRKYHICPVKLTDDVAKVYRMSKKARGKDGLHQADK